MGWEVYRRRKGGPMDLTGVTSGTEGNLRHIYDISGLRNFHS